MIKLNAKIRKETGRKTRVLKESGRIPAVVYGHKIENVPLDVDYKEFEKIYRKAGANSLIEIDVDGSKEKKIVLVHDFQKDAVSDKFIHIDFFETSAKEEVEVKIPLIFEGTSLAVKDLGGTLVKNISELQIKALPQNLPHEIKVSIDKLNTFEDRILVKDLNLPKDVKVSAKPDEIVASVAQPSKVEEELATEIKEEVENVEKVVKEKKEKDVVEETKDEKSAAKTAPDKK
ncbi:MAG: 50S ribosomal protein L25 [Candidatus Staskawiczbacteria bacterium]|nr:50S ribosomal protein L25 [Candidatus Staskawiczbacteria bacterium]